MSPLYAHFIKAAAYLDRAGDVAKELDPYGRRPGFHDEAGDVLTAIEEKRYLDLPKEIGEAALAGQTTLAKATGTNLPLVGAKTVVADARKRRDVWRSAFSRYRIPFSDAFVERNGDFGSPEAVRNAFRRAGKEIDETEALNLSVQMSQMYEPRRLAKTAAVNVARLREIIGQANKLMSHLGPDAADRYTMEHLGSVYRVAKKQLANQALKPAAPQLLRASESIAAPAAAPQQALLPFMNKGASLVTIESCLRRARNATHTHPTPAQAGAGNYRKGTLILHGMAIKLENPRGTERRGYDKDGNVTWRRTMQADYGYFQGTKAIDGDAVDCFIGPDPDSHFVVAVDQKKSDGAFDETKFVLGCTTQEQAEKLYLAHYPRGWNLGPVSTTTVQQLKEWLRDGNTKSPFKGQMVKAADLKSPQIPESVAKLRQILPMVGQLLRVTFGGAPRPPTKPVEPKKP